MWKIIIFENFWCFIFDQIKNRCALWNRVALIVTNEHYAEAPVEIAKGETFFEIS